MFYRYLITASVFLLVASVIQVMADTYKRLPGVILRPQPDSLQDNWGRVHIISTQKEPCDISSSTEYNDVHITNRNASDMRTNQSSTEYNDVHITNRNASGMRTNQSSQYNLLPGQILPSPCRSPVNEIVRQ